tara:strand:- start:77 stop:409 length:333 start_codon:yes stop_codon:yes gene_type:complete
MKSYFNKYSKDFKKLCTPAFLYLFISVLAFIILALQNYGNTNKFCLGDYSCNVPNTFIIFIFNAIYILFWTFLLNALCKAGYKEISWFLVLFPIIVLFVIFALILINFNM